MPNTHVALAPRPSPVLTPEPKRRRRGLLLLLLATTLGTFGLYQWSVHDPAKSKDGRYAPGTRMADRKVAYAPLAPAIPAELKQSSERMMAMVNRYVHPETRIAYSFTGDPRLAGWAVVYDNAIRIMAHLRTGDTARGLAALDYFIRSTAIKKTGWIRKDGKLVARPGWVVNIIDAAEGRPGGRGIEHIAHVGPNAYLGIAAVHAFAATGDRKYLDFARSRWDLIRDLQNEDPQSANYGGVRMGPLGDPSNDREQKLDFKAENPSFYDFYNGEHAADFLGFSLLLAHADPERAASYRTAADLIKVWDHRIWDPSTGLFFIGTTEKRYFDANIAQWVEPGVIPMRPLDTSALKISAYGVDGLDKNFGSGAAERVRQGIEDNFKVSVPVANPAGGTMMADGYDFVTHDDRARLVFYEERGVRGDQKVKIGVGRDPILSDEWSNWVSLADLRLSSDFLEKGDKRRAAIYLEAYRDNALINAMRTAIETADGTIAYPYAHPLPYALNKPVGFGWNTHHQPYALIGACARVLGFLRFDPFLPDGGKFALTAKLNVPAAPLVLGMPDRAKSLYTEAELYLQEGWSHVKKAELRGADEEAQWKAALVPIDRMMNEHPDWADIAKRQNLVAKASPEPYPLKGLDQLTLSDLEPVFRKYWALYHVGTAEFVRVMAYTNLRNISRDRGDVAIAAAYEEKARVSAHRLAEDFYYAQAYDESGWFWQPISSLREFVDFYY